jgi:hypothetical protein
VDDAVHYDAAIRAAAVLPATAILHAYLPAGVALPCAVPRRAYLIPSIPSRPALFDCELPMGGGGRPWPKPSLAKTSLAESSPAETVLGRIVPGRIVPGRNRPRPRTPLADPPPPGILEPAESSLAQNRSISASWVRPRNSRTRAHVAE